MSPLKASRLIIACVVLHNLALTLNEPEPDDQLDVFAQGEEAVAADEHLMLPVALLGIFTN